MANKPMFSFYERVHVRTNDGSLLTGSIMGRCENDDQKWHYSVKLDGKPTSSMFPEDELESTGVIDSREDFYDGSSVRVIVDEGGEGNPAISSHADSS